MSRPYADRQLLIVAHDVLKQVERLVNEAGASMERAGAHLDQRVASQRADRVIRQTVVFEALIAIVPVYVNFWVDAPVIAAMVVRIARAYGISLSEHEGREVARQLLSTVGWWLGAGWVGTKAVTALMQSTIIGYPAGVAISGIAFCSLAWALGQTSKLYFSEVSRGKEFKEIKNELGRTLKSSLKQARHQIDSLTAGAKNLPTRVDYQELSELFRSGNNKSRLIAEPGILRPLFDYMAAHQITDVVDLTADQLRSLDKEHPGLAQDMWDAIEFGLEPALPLSKNGLAGVGFVELNVNGSTVLIVDHGALGALHLSFPVGHPLDGLLYVGHPAGTDIYYPAAHFHRLTFEHKFAEAVRLLRFLGATALEVECVRGKGSEWSAQIHADLEKLMMTRGDAHSTAHSNARLLYRATFPESAKPRLPDNLVWYPSEPTWQEVAHARMDQGMKTFALSVKYDDDFQVNANVVGSIAWAKAGISVGGKFEKHEGTEWRISGSFERE
jgi:uncharacterized protein (DUF697 family)